MDLLIAFALSLVVGFVVSEVTDWLPKTSFWIVRRAANSLPLEEKDHYLEAWLRDIEETPGRLSKLVHAAFLYRAAFIISADASGGTLVQQLRDRWDKWNQDTEARAARKSVELAERMILLEESLKKTREVLDHNQRVKRDRTQEQLSDNRD